MGNKNLLQQQQPQVVQPQTVVYQQMAPAQMQATPIALDSTLINVTEHGPAMPG